MTNPPPAFQFYAADYLAEEKVQAMSIEGEGCYIRLLCYCWREGSIPTDRKALAALCKGYDGPGLDEALSCFILMKKNTKQNKNLERFFNKRLDFERKKQNRFHRTMKKAGINSAIRRKLGSSQASSQVEARLVARLNSSSSSSSSSSSIKKETRDRGDNRNNKEDIYKGIIRDSPLPPIPQNTAFEIKDTLEKLRLKIREIEGLAENEKKRQVAGLTQDEAQGKIKSLKSQYVGIVKELEETRKA